LGLRAKKAPRGAFQVTKKQTRPFVSGKKVIIFFDLARACENITMIFLVGDNFKRLFGILQNVL
jgi:hypothetical protein